MNAEDARKLALESGADQDIPLDADGEAIFTPEALCLLLWETKSSHIKARSALGKTTAWLEPFVNLPGKLHKGALREEAMRLLMERLHKDGYKRIEWDLRDGRPVLRFQW